jgi:site-specific DNA-adenine methylase
MGGYVHDILMDAYFHVLLVENYTDISFDENQPEDILSSFDELESSGALSIIIDAIDQKEYNSLYQALEILKENVNEYNRSQASALRTLQELAEESNQK